MMSTAYNENMRIIARSLHFCGLFFIAIALSLSAMGFAEGFHYSLFPSLAHQTSVKTVAESPADFDGRWIILQGMYYNTEDMSGQKGVLVPLSSLPQYHTLDELKQFLEIGDIPDSIPAMRPYPQKALKMYIPASIRLLLQVNSFDCAAGDTITVIGKFLNKGGIVFPSGNYIRVVRIMSAGSSPANNALILSVIILCMITGSTIILLISSKKSDNIQSESSSSL